MQPGINKRSDHARERRRRRTRGSIRFALSTEPRQRSSRRLGGMRSSAFPNIRWPRRDALHRASEIRNPNIAATSEARPGLQIRNKFDFSETIKIDEGASSVFRPFSIFDIVSDFDIRISDILSRTLSIARQLRPRGFGTAALPYLAVDPARGPGCGRADPGWSFRSRWWREQHGGTKKQGQFHSYLRIAGTSVLVLRPHPYVDLGAAFP